MNLFLALLIRFGVPVTVIISFGRRQERLNEAMSRMGDGPSHGAPQVEPNHLETGT